MRDNFLVGDENISILIDNHKTIRENDFLKLYI